MDLDLEIDLVSVLARFGNEFIELWNVVRSEIGMGSKRVNLEFKKTKCCVKYEKAFSGKMQNGPTDFYVQFQTQYEKSYRMRWSDRKSVHCGPISGYREFLHCNWKNENCSWCPRTPAYL